MILLPSKTQYKMSYSHDGNQVVQRRRLKASDEKFRPGTVETMLFPKTIENIS